MQKAMPATDEDQLVAQAQAGDQAALADLLQSHQNRLYNIVLRMVHHREDAAELTQDAMLKIVQHIGDFERGSAIGTWMVRIAMNLSISHLRKQKLRRAVSLDVNGSGVFGNAAAPNDQSAPLRSRLADEREPSPDECVQQREMMSRLTDAIARLEADFRAVLVLRDIDQMDYQGVSQILSVPVGTVKSRLFRARLALRRELLKTELPSTGSPGASVAGGRGAGIPEVADG